MTPAGTFQALDNQTKPEICLVLLLEHLPPPNISCLWVGMDNIKGLFYSKY